MGGTGNIERRTERFAAGCRSDLPPQPVVFFYFCSIFSLAFPAVCPPSHHLPPVIPSFLLLQDFVFTGSARKNTDIASFFCCCCCNAPTAPTQTGSPAFHAFFLSLYTPSPGVGGWGGESILCIIWVCRCATCIPCMRGAMPRQVVIACSHNGCRGEGEEN